MFTDTVVYTSAVNSMVTIVKRWIRTQEHQVQWAGDGTFRKNTALKILLSCSVTATCITPTSGRTMPLHLSGYMSFHSMEILLPSTKYLEVVHHLRLRNLQVFQKLKFSW
jgi:hypothetical protein